MSMARSGKEKQGKGRVKGVLALVGLGDQPMPEFTLEAVDPSGKRKAIPFSASGEFHLDEALTGQGYTLELRAGEGGEARRFAYDAFLGQIKADAVYRLPKPAWEALIPLFTCVSGQVKVCRPIRPPRFAFERLDLVINQARAGGFPALLESAIEPIDLVAVRPFFRCRPVCQGKVEVFVRTCCCRPLLPIDPPVVIRDLCKIIDCERLWPRPRPWPEPDPGPGPFPGPRPGPGPDPAPFRGPMQGMADVDVRLERATLRALKRADTVEGAPDAQAVLEASGHLRALLRLSLEEQVRYIEAYPDLRVRLCTCSMVKVAEVHLQQDGHFDACFVLNRLPANCHRRVLYRVSQVTESGWQVIYDGPARHQSFNLSEQATLYADWRAQACEDPREWGPTPFVILEQIGNTWADGLIHSTQQDGETSFGGPLAATDGLVNPAPAGPVGITAGPYDQPWGGTLNLRYQFHPGMKALGAKYFRTRVVRVDANGNAIAGSEFPLTGSVSWRKYADDGSGGVKVVWVPLNSPTPGLYEIPYHDPIWPWLGGQWHAFVVTDERIAGVPRMPNGRYLFVVDIFRADGKRLRPTNSLDAAGPDDVNAAFHYRRLDGPIDAAFSNTSVVRRNALASLFRVDNLACYGDIEAIMRNGVASNMNCQFLSGPAGTLVALQYSARHDNGFQWYHQISYKQGLTGPTIPTVPPDAPEVSNANVTSGSSVARNFSAMLTGETKCAFSANLYVYTKHTNGIGRLSAYDASDVAAFALEITPGP
jgi:hypothetical protein